MAIGRRKFLGVAAGIGAGAAAGLAASPAPWRAAMDLTRLTQDPPWLPDLPKGPLERFDTVSLACPSGIGVTVLFSQGRPILVRGNPDHPLSAGAVTPQAQAEAVDLYRPDRVLSPLLKNDRGGFDPVSWAAALDLLAARLGEAGPDVMAVGGSSRGTLQQALASFMEGIGAGRHYRMPSEADLARAAARVMGGEGTPGYDLDNAPGLVALGADLFGSMPASPHFRKAFAPRREAPSISFGPERGPTAALCRQWRPLPSGAEAALAMGIAGELAGLGRVNGKAPDLADFLALARQRFGPDRVKAMTGVPPEALREAAKAVAAGALPVPGASCGRGLGVAPFVAGLALCVLTGRVNRPGGVWLTRDIFSRSQDGGPDLLTGLKDIALGLAPAPAALLIVESDPAAGLAESVLCARAVAKAGFKAALTRTMTESAKLCDLILPTPMPLERWDDVTTPYGLAFCAYGLARPLTRARGDVRHPGDVLAELSARLGLRPAASSFKQALRRTVSGLDERGGYVAGPVAPWEILAGKPQPAPEAGLWEALEAGLLWADPRPESAALSCGARFLARALAPPAIELSAPLTLALRVVAGPGEGVPPQLLQAAIRDNSRDGLPAARLNAATARAVRVKQGHRIRLSGSSGKVDAVVVIDESVADGHVLLPLGLDESPGGDPLAAASALPEPGSGVQVFAGCRVRVERA
ncbi:MAG: molybdopterin-dependent oxidoreductase [Thermodesulfobacteriota bacterium]